MKLGQRELFLENKICVTSMVSSTPDDDGSVDALNGRAEQPGPDYALWVES